MVSRAEEVRTGRDSRDRDDRADRVVGTGRISETDSAARVAVVGARLASRLDDGGDRERDAEACRHQRRAHHALVVGLVEHRTADRVDRRVGRSVAVDRNHRSRPGAVAVVDDRLRRVDTEAGSPRSDVLAARYVLEAVLVDPVVLDFRAPVSVSSMSLTELDL